MSAKCEVCGKGPGFGMNVSHSHRRTKRRWNPNLQVVRRNAGGGTKKIKVCTSCLKAGKV
ncbi:MAG: 50S ribosomal protein L28 [Actinobacteria bacterium]|nr:50S ribosomal protein L28 [Actinomycetota bacterium]